MRILLFSLLCWSLPAAVTLSGLRCEYLVNPEGIDVQRPRLSWVLSQSDPSVRGTAQTAYRVQAGTQAGGADLWDSGRVESAQSVHLEYAGRQLLSGQLVFWRVMVWDQDGKPTAWSTPARWSMGLLAASDWKGQWIGLEESQPYRHPASPFHSLKTAKWIWRPGAGAQPQFFERTVAIDEARKVKSAMFTLGADQIDLIVNGTHVGQSRDPRMPYTFFIEELLRPGDNQLSVRVKPNANARTPAWIGALRVVYTTGEPETFVSDASWDAAVVGSYGDKPWGEAGFAEEHVLPARYLRKEFQQSKPIKRAVAYVSGLGLSELYLNGRKVGDHVLSPNLSEYEKRVFYVAHDVTSYIAAGKNAAGLVLGNGRWWAPRDMVPIRSKHFGAPRAIVQIEIEAQDGSRSVIVTGPDWQATTDGPVGANNEYDGEEYDARKEMPGWSAAGFLAKGWQPAQALPAPQGALTAQMAEPLRVMETRKPAAVAEPHPGVFVFDFGQNMVGWARLRVSGPRGAQVQLRFAETVKSDGMIYVDNLRSSRNLDLYTLKGGGPESWEPRFTYHGFRYVEVRGFPGRPTLSSLEGRVVHDAMRKVADFTSSDPLLNRIHQNVYWGVRSNYRSIPTDCPQRDERQGWLGDRSVVSRSESYLHDVAALYGKWVTDIADSQRPNGSIPDVAPSYWILYNDDVTWPSTFLLAPHMLYEQYGDRRVIERHYPAMQRWIAYMSGFIQNGLIAKDAYGDWCVPPESPELIHSQDPARRTDKTLIATAYFIRMLGLMAKYARLTGRPAEADGYEARAASMREAFSRRFYNESKRQYDNGTQTSYILPLAFGLAPESERKALMSALVARIEKESDWHIGVGLIGAQWLMRTLTENGRADMAYRIATQKTYPGWGYMIEKGATTIWELWNGDTADPAMNSGNHVMQVGDLAVWLYEYLAGIRTDPEQPGFRRILLEPYPVEGLDSAAASHESMYGLIVSAWKRTPSGLEWRVVVPPNTMAVAAIPASSAGGITESGKTLAAAGLSAEQTSPGRISVSLKAGTYRFLVR